MIRIIAVQVRRVYPVMFILFALFFPTVLLATNHAPVITAEIIERLASVARINFSDMPVEAGRMELGWFALSADGARLAMSNREYELIVWNTIPPKQINTLSVTCLDGRGVGTLIDAVFYNNGRALVAAHASMEGYYLAYYVVTSDLNTILCSTEQVTPLRIWVGEAALTRPEVWLEYISNNPGEAASVQHSTALMGLDSSQDVPVETLPSGPENDPESFLRIGRIEPPLAITVTHDNLIKRWNLETGEVTATAQLDELPGAGQMNATGRYFVWRDAEAANLYMLDFETGENRLIAPLSGTYIPFLLLTVDADVAIGVNVGLEPVVVAWDTATGERYDLGEYRACNRQPDMVRLSQDGTTLVIGCDTGLDIWRIA